MQNADDFRYTAHKLLLALDASTLDLMKMVSISCMGSAAWRSAVVVQQASFAELHLHLGQPDAVTLMQTERLH
ncbi:hypothetical protein [Pseudomonas sp. NFR16]|uniref:hypothetical protein n=1 Tax=Pseudomonas sp. NFR16 TaxID=1566248 RepID=UPI0008D52EFB|nr:hypothetical protein [Pseudomonas sp. NFR16]SEI66667.1 hypothetical protein SAMN03159495_1250 [Pseudomonas sp. NFR16]